MSDKSDTKETDAEMKLIEIVSDDPYCTAWVEQDEHVIDVVSASFAKKLERERDEARRLAEFYLTTLSHGNSVYIGMKLPWEKP